MPYCVVIAHLHLGGSQPAQVGVSTMKHFQLTEWAEFARDMVTEETRAAMELHLATGCRKCGEYAAMFRDFAAIAATDASYELPASALRCADAIYDVQKPEKMFKLPRLLAQLVYDSSQEAVPAGIRTQQQLSHQALYEAGEFRLDLRLEQIRGSAQVSLVGQIENRKDPKRRVGSVPVFLSIGKEVVARTISNQFGEFQLNYQPRTHLRLHLPILQEHGRRIEVPLHSLLAGSKLKQQPGLPGSTGIRKGKK